MRTSHLLALAPLLIAACASTTDSAGPTAKATLRPASGSNVSGALTFTQIGPNRVRVTGEVTGHSAGAQGFHIHEKGDCSAPDAMSAGGHFNPAKTRHGGSPTTGHAGDMANIEFDSYGRASVNRVIEGISVGRDANGIIGRAVVVHMQPDDLKTDPTGNAGGRAACGVIN